MAVHDVDMQHLDACRLDTVNVFSQTCEIGGENGWKNLKHCSNGDRTAEVRELRKEAFFAASSRHFNDGNTWELLGDDLNFARNDFQRDLGLGARLIHQNDFLRFGDGRSAGSC